MVLAPKHANLGKASRSRIHYPLSSRVNIQEFACVGMFLGFDGPDSMALDPIP